MVRRLSLLVVVLGLILNGLLVAGAHAQTCGPGPDPQDPPHDYDCTKELVISKLPPPLQGPVTELADRLQTAMCNFSALTCIP